MTINIRQEKMEQSDIGMWLGWTLATGFGMLLGHVLLIPLVNVIDLGIARVIVPVIVGVVVGVSQWLVLRGLLVRSSDWILAVAAGWVVAYAIGLIFIQYLQGVTLIGLTVFGLLGVILGLFQGLRLRQELQTIWIWVLANVSGWTLGFFISQYFIGLWFGLSLFDQVLLSGVSSGIIGLAAGAVTGLALVWIVRQGDQENT